MIEFEKFKSSCNSENFVTGKVLAQLQNMSGSTFKEKYRKGQILGGNFVDLGDFGPKSALFLKS